MNVQCGNKNHPNGPWHKATPYPSTLWQRIVQWWRFRKYGCGCAVKVESGEINMRGQAKIVCKSCKENTSSDLFPDGHLQSDKYFMVCSACRAKTPEQIEQGLLVSKNIQDALIRKQKIKYDKMIQHRDDPDYSKLQDELWDKIHEQWDDDFDINADATSFTDSEEMNDMMKRYEEALILKLSGIEDKMPEWMDPGR